MKRPLKPAEVCRQLEIQPYVLKYWESEFPQLSRGADIGPRTYSQEEVALLRRIKQLLYEEGYTIAGARKKLAQDLSTSSGPLFASLEGEGAEAAPPDAATGSVLDSSQVERIETLESGLRELLADLRSCLEKLSTRAAEKPRRSGRGAAW